jgi:hypothetical protein
MTAVGTRSAQAASGNGPYYATPSWDQKLPDATRFVVLLDWNSEAVLDRETGLVWEQSPTIMTLPWIGALNQCVNRTIGNRKGWRLPSMPELASLIDPSVAVPGPALTPGHPFLNVNLSLYWPASADADNPTFAWFVGFLDGGVDTGGKALNNRIWCVRGGSNADQY